MLENAGALGYLGLEGSSISRALFGRAKELARYDRYESYERRQKRMNRELESLDIRRNHLIEMRKNGARTNQTAKSRPQVARETNKMFVL